MAVTASGNYYITFRDMYKNDIALDWLADTLKMALFTNSITPAFDTDTAYSASPYTSNEVGSPSGGVALSSTTITVATGVILTFDCADIAWSSQTFSGAVCGVVYDDTLGTKNVIMLNYFGGAYGPTSGVFTVLIPASGLHLNDLA
jgi:hypothetical protein